MTSLQAVVYHTHAYILTKPLNCHHSLEIMVALKACHRFISCSVYLRRAKLDRIDMHEIIIFLSQNIQLIAMKWRNKDDAGCTT